MKSAVTITVNGVPQTAEVEPRTLLVHLLREHLNLTGTHVGCDTSNCGACTVWLDGDAVKSCTVLAVQADGREVTTIEGISDERRPAPDAAGLPRAPRPPVRLLHAGHGDDRDQAARGEPGIRPTRRSATGSRATCAAAPATRTSSPPSAAPLGGDGLMATTAEHAKGIGVVGAAQGGRELLTGQAASSTISSCPGCCTWRSCAARSPMPTSPGSTRAAARGHAGRHAGADRRRPRVRGRRPVRLESRPATWCASPVRPPLAKGRVRHAGEPVGVVLAADRYAARDAADAGRGLATTRCRR